MKKPFPLHQYLLDRRPTIGSWIQAAHPANAEVLANAGYDWIALECEHSENDVRDFAAMARAIHGRGPAAVVRVRDHDPLVIRRMLDMGAAGVIVPGVNTAEAARGIVRCSRYPPDGERGYCFSRMNDWGTRFDDYLRTANQEIAVIVMIEAREAVANIDSILEVEGIDGVFIGPYDLSASCGFPGQTDHPEVVAAKRTVLRACETRGKAAGLHVVLPDERAVRQSMEDGFTFLCLGSDLVFMNAEARRSLQWARAGCSQRV